MTAYEITTTILAAIAVAVSIYTAWSQHRLQKENNGLQRAMAALAQRQLEEMARDEARAEKAVLKMDLVKTGRTSYKFVISNISDVKARNVDMELLLDDPSNTPLIESECREKLPAPVLSPGSQVTLIAALHMDTPLAYRALLKWTNPDDSKEVEETYVSL